MMKYKIEYIKGEYWIMERRRLFGWKKTEYHSKNGAFLLKVMSFLV